MVEVKILGIGCPNCQRLERSVRQVASQNHLEVRIEKITDPDEIMKWPILATPGLVINNRLISAGRVPDNQQLFQYLHTD